MIEIRKTDESVAYKVKDGELLINATVNDRSTLTIVNHHGDMKFMFTESKPEVVAAVGRMLIAASELITKGYRGD